jgi:hypothetical protein
MFYCLEGAEERPDFRLFSRHSGQPTGTVRIPSELDGFRCGLRGMTLTSCHVNQVDERMDFVAPFHDREDGIQEHRSLIADDVAAQDFVVGRNQ